MRCLMILLLALTALPGGARAAEGEALPAGHGPPSPVQSTFLKRWSPPQGLRAWGLGSLAAGVAVTAVGMALGAVANGYDARAAELDRATSRRGEYDELLLERDERAMVANVCYGVGAGLAAAGVIMALVAILGSDGEEPPQARLSPTARGLALAW